MNSIFGIYNVNHRPVCNHSLTRMQHALNHWNADSTGVWLNQSIGLGHVILHNDAPGYLHKVQPLVNDADQLTITADARIENRKELFEILSIKKWEENHLTDSQLILLLYKKYKEDCVKYLVGDFAFAIWDDKEQHLFCARDQMGAKPFFYYRDANTFAFASEKKALLTLNGLNMEASHHFAPGIMGNVGSAPQKIHHKNIYRLVGAHTLTLKGTRMRIVRYTTAPYIGAFKEKFTRAIRCRLLNKQQPTGLIGYYLYGG